MVIGKRLSGEGGRGREGGKWDCKGLLEERLANKWISPGLVIAGKIDTPLSPMRHSDNILVWSLFMETGRWAWHGIQSALVRCDVPQQIATSDPRHFSGLSTE